jgi:excisionase family DNA binding protein
MTDTDTAYITLEDAARLLGKSQRTVYRYAEQGRLATHDTPAGKLFDRSQVEALAHELNVTPTPIQPSTELVPLSDMLSALERERERTQEKERIVNQLMVRISDMREEIGRLQERTETQQKALTDADMARQRLTVAEDELQRYKQEIERLRKRTFLQWLLGR